MSRFHRRSPIAFAHRGGRAHFRDNTLEGFRHALDSGLTAVETDAWLTADDEVVLDHDGVVKRYFGLWRKPMAKVLRKDLPRHVPTLAELCELIGPSVDVHVDVKQREQSISKRVVEDFARFLPDSLEHLWLADDSGRMSRDSWASESRGLSNKIHIVMSTKRRRIHMPLPEFAKRTKDAGFDVINLPARNWDESLVSVVHDAGLLAFGYNAQSKRAIQKAFDIGLDGVYSDHVDRLVDALKEVNSR